MKVETLCARYKLGRILSCRPAGGTRNTSFLIATDAGNWFIRRRYSGYSQPERIAFDHAALDHLKARGAPVVAPVRQSWRRCDGESWLEENDEAWEVFPAIAGREFREGDANDLRLLAKGLAEFHLAGQDFKLRYDKLGPRGETDPAELLRLCQIHQKDAPAQQRYRDWIDQAAAELTTQEWASLPHTLVHGDVQPANVLIDSSGRAWFVDPDWAAWRPRIYDLAFAILLCCAQHPSPIRGDDIWSLTQPARIRRDLSEDFLHRYNALMWPLEPREREALRPQIILSWCHCRIMGAMKVPPQDRQAFLDRPPVAIEDLWEH
jgi:Ser/Thr protein kinase RdoA (MazF antagonist)